MAGDQSPLPLSLPGCSLTVADLFSQGHGSSHQVALSSIYNSHWSWGWQQDVSCWCSWPHPYLVITPWITSLQPCPLSVPSISRCAPGWSRGQGRKQGNCSGGDGENPADRWWWGDRHDFLVDWMCSLSQGDASRTTPRLLTWTTGRLQLFIKMDETKVERGLRRGKQTNKQTNQPTSEFCFRQVTFRVLLRLPCGDAEKAVGAPSLDFRAEIRLEI